MSVLRPDTVAEFHRRWEPQMSAECLLDVARLLREHSPVLARRKFEGRTGQGCLATLAGRALWGENAQGAGRRFLRRIGFRVKNWKPINSLLVADWDLHLRDAAWRAELAALFEKAAKKKRRAAMPSLWARICAFFSSPAPELTPETPKEQFVTNQQFLRALAVQLYGMSQAHAQRLGVGKIKPYVEQDLVRTVQAVSKTIPKLTEPFAVWQPGGVPTPDFRKIEALNDRRWKKAELISVPSLVATRRCGRQFGTERTGNLPRPLQATHELTVAELFCWYVEHDAATVDGWYGEGSVSFPGSFGNKSPDVFIFDHNDRLKKVLEVAGIHYGKDRLLELHRHCERHGVGYEIW